MHFVHHKMMMKYHMENSDVQQYTDIKENIEFEY